MPSHPEGKSLVDLVRVWNAATLLQKLWRKKWCKRTTIQMIQLFLKRFSQERISQMLLLDATNLIHKADSTYWVKKILMRIVDKMRVRERTLLGGRVRRDYQGNCNPTYFTMCMPLAAKQTNLAQDTNTCLLQSKEIAVLHRRVWTALELVMEKILLRQGVLGDFLDEPFDKLFSHFSTFTEAYRFTVVRRMLLHFFFFFASYSPHAFGGQLHAEAVSAARLEALMLGHKNDVLLLEKDHGFIHHGLGQQLKKSIQKCMDACAKRLRDQHTGERRYAFFEQGELRAKTRGEDTVLPSTPIFLSPSSDRSVIQELVHQFAKKPKYAHEHALQPIFKSERVRFLFERDLIVRLRPEHVLGPTDHRPVAYEAVQYIEKSLNSLIQPLQQLIDDFKPTLDQFRASMQSKSEANPLFFNRAEAEAAFEFFFKQLGRLLQRIYFHNETPSQWRDPPQKLEMDQKVWTQSCQQQTPAALSFVTHTQNLLQFFIGVIRPLACMLVKLDIAPFDKNLIEYERVRVVPSIKTQYTMQWLSPYVKARLPSIRGKISDDFLYEVVTEAIWELVVPKLYDEEHVKKSILEETFVWPETMYFDKQGVFELLDDMAMVTRNAVIFRMICRYLGIADHRRMDSFVKTYVAGAAKGKSNNTLDTNALEAFFKVERFPLSHLEYLIPLIQVRLNRDHDEYKATQLHMYQSLRKLIVYPLTVSNISDNLAWFCCGEKGLRIKTTVVKLINTNLAVFDDLYHQIIQTAVNDALLTAF